MNEQILYHGSRIQSLKILKLHLKHTPQGKIEKAAIYASDLPGYAATHSFRWSSADGVYLDVKESGEIIFRVPIQLKPDMMQAISIYSLKPDGFELCKKELVGHTWIKYAEAQIIDKKKFDSVLDALKFYGVNFAFTDGPVPDDAEF